MPVAELQRTYPRDVKLPGGQSVHLRLMTADDAPAMLEFAQGLNEEDLLFLRMDITAPDVVDRWVESLESGQRVSVLAESNGRLIGYGSLNRTKLTWTRHQGEIRVIISPSERRTGLGSTLAEEVYHVARDLDLTKIVAQMPVSQPGGRRLFESLGFKPEALLTDWVIDREGTTHDLLIMSYDVSGFTG